MSTQADELVRLIRRTKTIRKPIAGQAKFSPTLKRLLRKFDDGKITAKELTILDKAIKGKGAKGILERSFFADPRGRIRPSRLGIAKKEATFKDLITGQASLKKQKPQILVFEDIKVQKFPKSFNTIKRKISTNKPLTKIELKKLLQFQQQKSGKFKPLGFVSREAEITLAPGEVVKRVKKIGVTLVDGKRVPIVSVKVAKSSKGLNSLIKKARSGKITAKELKKLSAGLKKEKGLKYSSSSLKNTKNYFNLKRRLSSVAVSKVSRRRRVSRPVSKRKPSKVTPSKVRFTRSGRPFIVTSSGARFISPSSPKVVKKPSKKPVSKPVSKASSKPTTKKESIRFGVSKQIKKRKPRKPIPTFNVLGKSGKKFVKLNKVPLTRSDALSRGTFAIDHSTSKQFKIIPAGRRKKTGNIGKKEKNYFNRAGFKLREFKVKGGRKFAIKPKYIEKRKFAIDTRGEKAGLSLARLAKQRGFVGTRKPIQRKVVRRIPVRRKITPAQKKVMLANLRKARRVRKQNLKKR